jgi:hypothetical protein
MLSPPWPLTPAEHFVAHESARRGKMSNLIVLGFDGKHTADEVLNKLRSLQMEYLIDLEDSCVVERETTARSISSKPSISRRLGRQPA